MLKYGSLLEEQSRSFVFKTTELGIKETNYIHFAGPSFHRRLISNSQWVFSLTLSGGYAYYRGELECARYYSDYSIPQRALITDNAFGAYGGVGLEYFLNKHIALGLDMGYFHLSFDGLEVKTNLGYNQDFWYFVNSEDNDYSRLDFSFGLKVYF